MADRLTGNSGGLSGYSGLLTAAGLYFNYSLRFIILMFSNGVLDPSTMMFMSLNVTFTGTASAYTASYITGSFLLGTFGWSLFQRLQVYYGSQTLIDDI